MAPRLSPSLIKTVYTDPLCRLLCHFLRSRERHTEGMLGSKRPSTLETSNTDPHMRNLTTERAAVEHLGQGPDQF